MSRRVVIVRHLPLEELEERYRREDDSRVKERLLAILHLYEGRSIREASEAVRRSGSSVKRWLRRWNGGGIEGLKPGFKGGPKPRIPDDEWDKIIGEIEGRGMTIRDVAVYVRRTRGVEYAYKTVWWILRRKKRVKYGKPYIRSLKRAENAEDLLKKGLTKPYRGLGIQS